MSKFDEVFRDDVRVEYRRICDLHLSGGDPYFGNFSIGLQEIFDAHFLLVDYFFKIGEGIGGVGPKSVDLLHSAISRQFSSYAGRPKWSNRIEICATLLFGLIKNHPFYDANKRTAFLVSLLHLQKIGRTPKVEAKVFEDLTVAIADNKLDELSNSQLDDDGKVRFIATFLKRNTREIDLRGKLVTFNELNAILAGYGMRLEHPKGNKIDVVRYLDEELGSELKEPRRVAHIGFHGWTKEVSKKDIHIVRTAAKLDPQHGIDSQSFFGGQQTPLEMIRKYEEPLRRLAYR